MHPIILLTGGIASGKTFVSNYLSELNAHVIDTDVISRLLLQPNGCEYSDELIDKIVDHFGGHILNNGVLDRKLLRDIVFNDPEAKSYLENSMHPLIFKEVENQLKSNRGKYHLIVIPLLKKDSPYLKMGNQILAVEVDPKIQLERVMLRDHIDEDLARKIIESQISNQERRKLANTIIINTNEQYTRNILKQLDKKYSLAQF